MDNCDLEKLSISAGKLCPPFEPSLLSYKVTVPSNTSVVTLELRTSDCGASSKIHFGDGSNVIQLSDGINKICVEVVAEDGTTKMYCVEVTKLSASIAELCGLEIAGDVQIQPEFSPNFYEYSSTVQLFTSTVTIHPRVPDENMQVSVNGSDGAEPIPLNIGDTLVRIEVSSADGTKSQMYAVLITREQIPLAITFADARHQMEYECPFSLTAFHRPVTISSSDPKHIYSAHCIDVLARRSKVDPLDEQPLGESWKLPELDFDRKMSAAPVKCIFSYRGCEGVLKLSEVGTHAVDCPHKCPIKLDTKDVTETEWYKRHFASSNNVEIQTKHSLETRSWERHLWRAVGGADVQQLCSHAGKQLHLYRETLPKPGDSMQYQQGRSPLDCLDQAAVHYASAIKLKPRDAQLHFLLGQVLEEQHYAAEMYGLKKMNDEDDAQDLGLAKAAGRQEEILAVCRLHGYSSSPTLENQLKALDTELHQLKEQGLSEKADYIQTLFIWLSKRVGKDGRVCVSDEESWLHRALLKYLDAWTLRPESGEYSLAAGRLLLEQGRHREALPLLQGALALQASSPALRFYCSLALLQQESNSVSEQERAVLFLHRGLEHTLSLCLSQESPFRGDGWKATDPLSPISVQFLRGCLILAERLQSNKPVQSLMTAEQVYHTVVVLALRGVCRCVCRGQVTQQLEWLLLDAHFALLRSFTQRATAGNPLWVQRRCQALSALIRLTTIAPCRELLDMQEKVCQIGVMTAPSCGRALYLLGIAQLAQHDDSPESDRGRTALSDAQLSFQASIAVEGRPMSGPAPEQLTAQMWWQDQQPGATGAERQEERPPSASPAGEGGPAPRGGARGRGAPDRRGSTTAAKTPAPGRGCKHVLKPKPVPQARGRAGTPAKTDAKAQVKPNTKTQASLPVTSADSLTPAKAAAPVPVEEPVSEVTCELIASLNSWSHASRLGLARAYARSTETRGQACELYQEVIARAPKVHDAYIELGELLAKTDPLAAVDIYCRFPLNPVHELTFDDAFIVGEIVHILMKQELYDHPQLGPNLIAYGKIMGLGCLEKYIEVLDGKFKTDLLKTVYAGIHDKSLDDEDLQEFFKFKCWI